MKSPLAKARRIVIKVGSILLADPETGNIRRRWLARLADDLASFRKEGCEIIAVSSGAVVAGRTHFSNQQALRSIEDRQAAAAIGQISLANAWRDAFRPHGITVAQMLLGPADIEQRRNSLNARGTLDALLRLSAIPVINENDTVATDEIRYGDNDRLAARVAQLASAGVLVMLSSTDGLYTSDPALDSDARHVEEVKRIDKRIEAMAGKSASAGSGGMVTKLQAARIATAAGCAMVIVDGREPGALSRLAKGGRATWFLADDTPLSARKRWIRSQTEPDGELVIDTGAGRALLNGKSLLPAGVTGIYGDFQRGDPVLIKDSKGAVLGRGLVAYPASEAKQILGRKSQEIEEILGYRRRNELVHRDDMVLMRKA